MESKKVTPPRQPRKASPQGGLTPPAPVLPDYSGRSLEELRLLVAQQESRFLAPGGLEIQNAFLRHLAACVTLCDGLERAALQALCRRERGRFRKLGDPVVLAERLEELLPTASGSGAAPLPDRLGELFLLRNLGNGDAVKAQAAALRAFDNAWVKAMAVAIRCVDHFGPLGFDQPLNWLNAWVDQPELPLERLQVIVLADLLPDYHLDLNAFTAKVEGAIIQRLRTSKATDLASRAQLPRFLNSYSVTLSSLGRSPEALAPAQEAVDIYRDLVGQQPQHPDLAMSLNNLSNRLSEVGRSAEALAPAQEAVEIYRKLASQQPQAIRPDLAGSLNTLANRLSEVGRSEEALAPAQEAVDIYRDLAKQRPMDFRPDLAKSLNNLANRLSAVGRSEEALAPAQEAVALYRDLASKQPQTFRPFLAGSLNNLAIWLSEVGRSAEALAPAQEAVDIRRDLATQQPQAFRPDLAASLNNLAKFLSEVDRSAEALAPAQEAVAISRSLNQVLPDAFRGHIQTSLNTLATVLQHLGRSLEARDVAKEFSRLRRESTLPHSARVATPADADTFRIDWIDLERIGPFEAMRIVFEPRTASNQADIHLFTGPNGSGKSTLLYAMANHFQEVQSVLVARRCWTNSAENLRIGFNHEEWLQEYRQIQALERSSETDKLPFAVFTYSGGRTTLADFEVNLQEIDQSPLHQALSFHNSMPPEALLQWIAGNLSQEALARVEGNVEEAQRYRKALQTILDTLRDITGRDFEFRMSRNPLRVRLWDGQHPLSLDVLPDGLKSILSWLGNLMMRLDHLTRANPEVSTLDKPFLLFLDEIEIHLHPSWQRRLLPAMQKLFPRAQIFATTHSPFVVNSVKGAWVYALDPEEVRIEAKPSGAGLSYITVLDEVFGITQRFDPETETMLNQFRGLRETFLQNPQDEDNRRKLGELMGRIGERGAELHGIMNRERMQMQRLAERDPIDDEI
ncbi:MAG: tetratricopeptide repeat protein [Magnetococcales bacterium]|nr:tetratricopeptide repeat protein [Magnetococcales bacterium]